MQTARTGDPRYCNWVKDTLALLYLKEGLEVFVDQQAAVFHYKLKGDITSDKCTCDWQALGRDTTTWTVKKCPNGTCQTWLNLIVSHHRNKPIPKLTPENTNPALWPTDSWEVMKVYQPRGCRDQHSAKEADVAAILATLNNCDHFWPFLTELDDINDLLQMRNRTMHSSDFLVDDQDMTTDFQIILRFLRGLKSLSTAENQPVQTAILKIKQLRADKLDLCLNRELQLRTIQAQQLDLKTEMGNLGRAIEDVNNDVDTVKAKLDTDVQALQQRLCSQLSLINTVRKDMDTQQQTTADLRNMLIGLQRQFDVLRQDLENCKNGLASIANTKQTVLSVQDLQGLEVDVPIKRPLTFTVINKGTVVIYGNNKALLNLHVADELSFTRCTVYDPSKFALLNENQTYIVHNFINKDGFFVINKPTEIFVAATKVVPEGIIEQFQNSTAVEEKTILDSSLSPKKTTIKKVTGIVLKARPIQVKRVRTAREEIPLKRMEIGDSSGRIDVCLWRDMALKDFSRGDLISLHYFSVTDVVEKGENFPALTNKDTISTIEVIHTNQLFNNISLTQVYT